MTAAALRAVATAFLRDRGAVVMALLVPIPVFLVFAAAFAGAGRGRVSLVVALADEQGTEASRRMLEALRDSREPGLRFLACADGPCVAEHVRAGRAEAGLVVARAGRALGDPRAPGSAPIRVVRDPSRAAAAQIVAGLAQRRYVEALPDLALRDVLAVIEDEIVDLTPGQKDEVDAALGDIERAARQGTAEGPPPLVSYVDAAGGARGDLVPYYAGAVAVLFVLFSAAHAALGAAEDEASPLTERLATLPGGLWPLLLAKFLFVAALGTVQILVMFAVAWALHGVDLPAHAAPTALVSLAAAAAAGGIALAVTGACRTRRQGEVAANVVALVASAVGGSMIPRFLMPESLRAAGWLTPNAWAMEAFTALYWRGEGFGAIMGPMGVLLGFGLAGLLTARRLARRAEVL